MKKSRILALLMAVLMSFAFLVGCGGSKASVKDDLSNYDKEASTIMAKMKDSDPQDMKAFKAAMEDMKKQLGEIKIETKDVKDLNKLLITGLDGLIGAYGDLEKATKNNDTDLASKAQEKATNAQKDMESFQKKIEALAKKEGVTLKLSFS